MTLIPGIHSQRNAKPRTSDRHGDIHGYVDQKSIRPCVEGQFVKNPSPKRPPPRYSIPRQGQGPAETSFCCSSRPKKCASQRRTSFSCSSIRIRIHIHIHIHSITTLSVVSKAAQSSMPAFLSQLCSLPSEGMWNIHDASSRSEQVRSPANPGPPTQFWRHNCSVSTRQPASSTWLVMGRGADSTHLWAMPLGAMTQNPTGLSQVAGLPPTGCRDAPSLY